MLQLIVLCLITLFQNSGTNLQGQKSFTDPLILNKGPHLFIDDYLIAYQSFLTRVVNSPQNLDRPVLTGGEKNDQVFQPYLSILHDEQTGKFRMWYNSPVESKDPSYCHIAYTESPDGIHWQRPPEILKDPHEIQFNVSVLDQGIDYKDKCRRYILAAYLSPGLRISTSPDGLNWTSVSDKPVVLHTHDINSLYRDPIRNQYIAIVSQMIKGYADPTNPSIDDARRIPHETVSKDLISWEPIWQIISPKLAPKEKGETQFYSMSGILARGDLLVGLVKVLRDDLNAEPDKSARDMGDMTRKAAGTGYTVLAWSHDGRTWDRDYEPFISNNSMPGTFDHAVAWGDEQIIVGNEIYIYYGGYERGHKVNRFEERHIGLACIPVDRYVSRDADLNIGTLLTKPIIINAGYLTVNANVRGEGRIRLLDSKCQPIDGYGWISFMGDSVAHKIAWNKSLKNISGKPVCLEFELRDAQLFGFDLH
jgi:hypothetical protein